MASQEPVQEQGGSVRGEREETPPASGGLGGAGADRQQDWRTGRVGAAAQERWARAEAERAAGARQRELTSAAAEASGVANPRTVTDNTGVDGALAGLWTQLGGTLRTGLDTAGSGPGRNPAAGDTATTTAASNSNNRAGGIR